MTATTEVKDCPSCLDSLGTFMLQLIGHEIRNPLTIIGGNANLLCKKTNEENSLTAEEKEVIRKLNIIKKEAERAFGIMSIFDNFVENPKFNPEETDIHDSLTKVIKVSSDDRIKFTENYILSKQVYVDTARISFALLNIINNAKDAVLEKSRHDKNHICEITITTGEEGQYFFIDIENNGVHIDEKIIDKILQRSFTTKDNGTGFGLTFAGDMVRQHKGHLKVKSDKERTNFSIFIPLEL